MKKGLATFGYAFRKSITSISYYHDVIHASFFFSLKYFFSLLVVIYLVQYTLASISLAVYLPQVPSFQAKIHHRLNVLYPHNLIIEIQKGTLSTNAKKPVNLDIPELGLPYSHFLTINTQATLSDYKKGDSLMLITKNGMVYSDGQNLMSDNSEYSFLPFDPEETTVINYESYTSFKDRIFVVVDFLASHAVLVLLAVAFVLPILMATVLFMWNMVYISVCALFFLIVASLFKLKLRYSEVFQIILHASTLPQVFMLLLLLLGIYIPFLYTAFLLFWVVIILSRLPSTKR